MALIRTFLNNGFFILVLIVAVTLFLAYSDSVKRDHGLLDSDSHQLDADSNANMAETEVASATIIDNAMAETVPTDNTATVVAVAEEEASVSVEAETANTAEKAIEATPAEDNAQQVAAETVDTTATDSNKTVPSTAIEKAEAVVKTVVDALTPEAGPEVVQTDTADSAADTVAKAQNPSATQASHPQSDFVFPVYDEANLEAILSDDSLTEGVPEFDTTEEAYNAARQAFYDKDYLTAEKIYFSMLLKKPSANVAGELGNVLFIDNKKDWANRAWIESAKLLIQENRVKDAYILANRLHPVAPQTARKIGYHLAKMMAAKHNQNRAAQHPQPSAYPAPAYKPMPSMPKTEFKPQAMPPMQPMQMDPRMVEMQKVQQERHKAFMEQMRQQQAQPPARMPAPHYPPAPQHQMPPMQNMQPMAPMSQSQFKAQPVPPMQPMKVDPRILEMQKVQQERHKAFMEQMRQQQAPSAMPKMTPPSPMPAPKFEPALPPMQEMKPMDSMTQKPFKPQTVASMKMHPRMIEMQKLQQQRHQAFMQQVRQQQMALANFKPQTQPTRQAAEFKTMPVLQQAN